MIICLKFVECFVESNEQIQSTIEATNIRQSNIIEANNRTRPKK